MRKIVLVLACIPPLLASVTLETFAQAPTISPVRMKARKELGQLSVEYSKESFIKRASEGDTIAVQLFIAAGMDPNTHYGSDSALTAAARNGYTETVQVLLGGGAEVNAKAVDHTPLMLASRTHVMKVLLDHGADVNVKGWSGETPLMSAARRGQPDSVKLLVDKGADVSAKNTGGATALLLAVELLPFNLAPKAS